MIWVWVELTHGNIQTLEMIRIPDPGEHQQLRRVDRSAAQNDLWFREPPMTHATAVNEFDADRADPVEKDAIDENVWFHLHVGPGSVDLKELTAC